jgi:hypothetical protein
VYVGENRKLVERLLKEAKGNLRLIERAYEKARAARNSDTEPVTDKDVIEQIHRLNGSIIQSPN